MIDADNSSDRLFHFCDSLALQILFLCQMVTVLEIVLLTISSAQSSVVTTLKSGER